MFFFNSNETSACTTYNLALFKYIFIKSVEEFKDHGSISRYHKYVAFRDPEIRIEHFIC